MFRAIPSIDKCIRALREAEPALASTPQSLLTDLARAFWESKREEIRKGACADNPDLEQQLPKLLAYVRKALDPALKRVINATGVVIHTNLGRSILARQAGEAAMLAAEGYCNLEMNLENGQRGSRHTLTSDLIRRLTDAQDSMVVNNNAAAVLLVLDTFCAGGETIVSRGELVEIGGSFRIPDIMLKSGTILREVGTTNRTHLDDYKKAINDQTKALMRVHASNFRIVGFHTAPKLKELAALAHENCLPLIFDLGSGNLLDLSEAGLPHELTVREIMAQGADLVCFSGDKALGGPQAGIIAGKASLVEKLKKNPLARALRCDKLCLAALEATLRLYLDPEQAKKFVPTQAMLCMSPETLAKNARSLANILRRAFNTADISCQIKLATDTSRAGGGSFPECGLPTTLVCLTPASMPVQTLRHKLLSADVPIVGRLEKDSFCLDPRTLERKDYRLLASTLAKALAD